MTTPIHGPSQTNAATHQKPFQKDNTSENGTSADSADKKESQSKTMQESAANALLNTLANGQISSAALIDVLHAKLEAMDPKAAQIFLSVLGEGIGSTDLENLVLLLQKSPEALVNALDKNGGDIKMSIESLLSSLSASSSSVFSDFHLGNALVRFVGMFDGDRPFFANLESTVRDSSHVFHDSSHVQNTSQDSSRESEQKLSELIAKFSKEAGKSKEVMVKNLKEFFSSLMGRDNTVSVKSFLLAQQKAQMQKQMPTQAQTPMQIQGSSSYAAAAASYIKNPNEQDEKTKKDKDKIKSDSSLASSSSGGVGMSKVTGRNSGGENDSSSSGGDNGDGNESQTEESMKLKKKSDKKEKQDANANANANVQVSGAPATLPELVQSAFAVKSKPPAVLATKTTDGTASIVDYIDNADPMLYAGLLFVELAKMLEEQLSYQTSVMKNMTDTMQAVEDLITSSTALTPSSSRNLNSQITPISSALKAIIKKYNKTHTSSTITTTSCTYAQAFGLFGISFATSAAVTTSKFQAAISSLSAQRENINAVSQQQMLSVQGINNKRSDAYQTASTISKRWADVSQAMVQNF